MVASDRDSINTCSDKIAFKAHLRLTKPKPCKRARIRYRIRIFLHWEIVRPIDRPAREFTIVAIVICIRSIYYRVPLFTSSVTKYHGIRLKLSTFVDHCFIIFRLPSDTSDTLWFLRSSAQVFLRLLHFLEVCDCISEKGTEKLGKAFTFYYWNQITA